MADNIAVTPGVGATVGADEIGGVLYQRVKVGIGADGTAADWSTASPGPVAGNVAHDAADAGNPVKVGGRARTSLPAAVANDDRSDLVADARGRLLVTDCPPEAQFYATGSYTTAQTGTQLTVNVTSAKQCVQTLTVNVYGATAGRVTVWWGTSGETSIAGEKYLFDGDFAPAVTGPQTVVLRGPFYGLVDEMVMINTSAGISVRATLTGYEY